MRALLPQSPSPGEELAPRRRRGCSALLLLLLLLVGIYLLRVPLLTACARFLIVPDVPRRADVVVALGGGRGDREIAAAEFFQKGMAGRVILTGGMAAPRGVDLSWPEVMARHLKGAVPTSLLILETRSRSTYEDAVYTLEDLRALQAASVLVVTDPYHLRRTRATFRHVFSGSGIALCFVPTPGPWFEAERWWEDEDALVAVVEEYLKMINYAYRYRIWPWS